MLETFQVATFHPRIGERFRIASDDASLLDAVLIEATALGEPAIDETDPHVRRAPFSLVFRADAGRILPQRIYRVEHEEIEAFDLFLVPIGPDREGMRYEAIFT